MSVNVGSAYLEIIPSAKGFASKLQGEVGSSAASVGKSAGDKAGKGFGSAFGGRVKSIIGAGAALAVGATALGFLHSSIDEARESQKVGALTAQVIKTTGGAANITAKQMGALSTAISNKVGIDDEQIQSGANMLLTFKNIRNEAGKNNKIFNQATAITTDMAASMAAASGGQIDLKSSSIQVGKALNDPVKGITALSRVGVTFTEQQKKQIGTLVKHGKTLDAQKIILRELKSEFGGAAAATATNGDKMRVAFGNLEEQIGTALLPVIDKIQKVLVDKVIPAISEFFSEMQSGTGTGGEVADILGKVFEILGKVVGFLAKHKETVVTFVAVLGAMAAAFAVVNAVMAVNPISLVVLALAALVTGLILAYKHSETFRKIVDAAFHGVAAAIDFAKDHWRLLIILILGPFGAAIAFVIDHFHAIQNVCRTVFKFIVDAFFTVVGALIHGAAKAFGWVPGIGGKLKAAAKDFDAFRDSVNRALDGIHSVKEIRLNVTTRQLVLNPSLAKPRTQASGGYISGPGTGTSDSIPAYLSNGEYVIKADAVAKYGVAMFDRLNSQRYATGGLVSLTRASGNAALAGAGSAVELEQGIYRGVGRALADHRVVIMPKANLEELDLLVGAG